MVLEVGAIAAAIVKLVAPFSPFLLDAGKAAGTKLAETIGEKGGESAWQKAQAIWQHITSRFSGDAKLQATVSAVATDPTDEDFLKKLATLLSERLAQSPELAQELVQLIGGQQAIQQVIAERGSWIEEVLQSGSGQKTVKASDDSVIKGIKQIS